MTAKQQNEKNNWVVITGGPSSGKTSLLKELEKFGHRVEFEAARLYIDQEMAQGRSIEEIRADELYFQREVLRRKVIRESELPAAERIFFDRGVPDSIAYFSLCGAADDPELAEAVQRSSYKKVFLLELLDHLQDYARTESSTEREKLQLLLEKTYSDRGDAVIKVPDLGKVGRARFILENL